MLYSFVSKADETWKLQKSLALQFWIDSNFKFKMKLGDVNLSGWCCRKCCDLCVYLLQFIFTRLHTFLVITDPSCISNNFPFELLQYSLFLSSFRAALNTNTQIYHTFFHISPLEFQLMDHYRANNSCTLSYFPTFWSSKSKISFQQKAFLVFPGDTLCMVWIWKPIFQKNNKIHSSRKKDKRKINKQTNKNQHGRSHDPFCISNTSHQYPPSANFLSSASQALWMVHVTLTWDCSLIQGLNIPNL